MSEQKRSDDDRPMASPDRAGDGVKQPYSRFGTGPLKAEIDRQRAEDRISDGRRLVALSRPEMERIVDAVRTVETEDAALVLADRYEDGITKEEQELLSVAAQEGILGGCPEGIEAASAESKLRAAFSTQKDSGDGG